MALYNHHGPISDPWIRADGNSGVVSSGAKIVFTLDELLALGHAAFGSDKSVGVEVATDTELDQLTSFIDRLGLISIRFDSFKDGRGFSLARRLRERGQFAGELRATGDILPDQIHFFVRVGFSTFELPSDISAERVTDALHRYTVWYQKAADSRTPVQTLRTASRMKAAE